VTSKSFLNLKNLKKTWYLSFGIMESRILEKFMAWTEAMKGTIWLQGLLDDLGIEQDLLKINCDSMSAIHLVKNQVYHARTKHIDVRFHFV